MNLQPKYSANVIATEGSLAGVINTISDKYHVSAIDIWMDEGLRIRITGRKVNMSDKDVEVEIEALKRLRNMKINDRVRELGGKVDDHPNRRGRGGFIRRRRGRGRGRGNSRQSSTGSNSTSGVSSDSTTRNRGSKNRKSRAAAVQDQSSL